MPKEVGHDGEGGGGSETGGSPARVDGLETVCRRLLLDNGSDTMVERKQCHSLLDWLILRCNHQWQFMNLAGTPVTRAVLVEEVFEIMNAVSRIMSPMLILLKNWRKRASSVIAT